MGVVAYHDVSGDEHQERFDELSGKGFRLLSLSVYGPRAKPQYAAVWIERSGPAWRAVHDATAGEYQAAFDKARDDGFIPVLITATGPRSNPVLAGTFVKKSVPVLLCKFGLTNEDEKTAGSLRAANKWARRNGCILRSGAVYGSESDPAFAGVWLPNDEKVKWQANLMGASDSYQRRFDAYLHAGLRPAFADVSDSLFYLGCFRDDAIGPFVARHDMTSAEYQTEFDEQKGKGRFPIAVHAGGVQKVRFAAVFAERDQAFPRQWHRTTSAGASLASIHAVMKSFMTEQSVRAGALAIRQNGVLKLAAGYTWAEPGYPHTQPNSLFRLASVSKMFACDAVQRLVEAGKLDLDEPVFPLLGITKAALATQQPSKWIDEITVRHCIQHEGGWDSDIAKDPMYDMRGIARALGLPGRVSKFDIARYMYGEPLQFEPGTSDAYSNFGYHLLALVVEKRSGQSFAAFLKQKVLAPVGITGVLPGKTLRKDRFPSEVTYDCPDVGSSHWDPWSDEMLADAYGGSYVMESKETSGGLIATAPAITSFIHSRAVWGMGGRKPGASRSGSMPGTSSLAASRANGTDYCYVFNTRTLESGALATLRDELGAAMGAAGL